MSIREAIITDLTWNAVAALTDVWLHRIEPQPISPGLAIGDTPEGLRIYAVELHKLEADPTRYATLPIEALIGEAPLDALMIDPKWARALGRRAVELLMERGGVS